jgi:peptidoglycan/xylan/chitin deacetylase (PgdA/CDA1 family)
VEKAPVAEARRSARQLSSRGETAELRAAGRALRTLVDAVERPDSARVDAERLALIRRHAEDLVSNGGSRELNEAARMMLALSSEIDGGAPSIELELEQVAPPEPAERPDARPAPARRPRPTSSARPRRKRPRRTPVARRRPAPTLPSARALAALGIALVLAVGIVLLRRALAPDLEAAGPRSGSTLGRAGLASLTFSVRDRPEALSSQRWLLDGEDVTRSVRAVGDRLVFHPMGLEEGDHRMEVSAGGGFLGARATRRFDFAVDTTPPPIQLAGRATAHAWEPLTLRGTLGEHARLAVDGRPVEVKDDSFSVRRQPPLPRALVLSAVDAAGNRTLRKVKVELVPRRPPVPVRAVHVTFYAWADADLRAGILQLIDERRVNAVELDLKDESGVVGFDADVPLGKRIGAVQQIYDLPAAVRQLHARGVRVIGRLVCFRDAVHAAAAWKAGRRNEVIQTRGGEPYAGYGGFTNFANPAVRRYNIDIAVAAARAGVDDVLYDYVRRPDGPTSSMVFPGLRGDPGKAIVEFLRESRLALRPYRTYVGASVFGVAATRPEEVAQPIASMARKLDYVAPMVYPSHWGPGEYGVSSPNSQPYEIVRRSLADFRRDVTGSGARVVPWLQDFSLGVTYGPAEVRAQIEAARRNGIREFILWDPLVTYTAEALSRDAPRAKSGLAKPLAAKPAAPPPEPAAPAATSTAPAADAPRAVGGRKPNELGVVPVLMHHEIRPDRVGEYDQKPAEFRTELEQLWRQGYVPVRAIDLVTRDFDDVPAGKTPVVLTFDDSTRYQLTFTRPGVVKRDTAVGVMLDFARTHPGFEPAGTFYVLREPFGGVAEGGAMLRWLVAHGFELGNHTPDHLPLRTLDATKVQNELVRGQQLLTDAVPGYRVRTMALPVGSMPKPASLAVRGRWHGRAYHNEGVFLVGANPAPSPYSTDFDPAAIPRIRSSHLPWRGGRDFAAAFWLHELAENPSQRYVSDGDPAHVTFPRAERQKLRPRFRSLARPY